MKKIPLINVAPYTVPFRFSDSNRRQVAQEIDHACRTMGFFYVTGHGIPSSLLTHTRDVARQFFELPQVEKEKISITKSHSYRGYQKIGQNVTQNKRDWHEAIDWFRELPRDHPSVLSNNPLASGTNQWPSVPHDFKATFDEYVIAMLQAGTSIMKAMAIGLGLSPYYFQSYYNHSFWVMRAISYPPLQDESSLSSDIGMGCGEHTDYGCLTLVNADPVPNSLQVKSVDGTWIPADPVEDALVVNVGDMMEVWTRGAYISTPHRVRNHRVSEWKTNRVSVPFFFEPNFDAIIEPLLHLREKENGSRYGPVMYGDHLMKKVYSNFNFNENNSHSPSK